MVEGQWRKRSQDSFSGLDSLLHLVFEAGSLSFLLFSYSRLAGLQGPGQPSCYHVRPPHRSAGTTDADHCSCLVPAFWEFGWRNKHFSPPSRLPGPWCPCCRCPKLMTVCFLQQLYYLSCLGPQFEFLSGDPADQDHLLKGPFSPKCTMPSPCQAYTDC